MPQFNKKHADLEPAPGLVVNDDDPQRLDAALDLALDYRGDVTLYCRPGDDDAHTSAPSADAPIEGYLYDRKRNDDPERAAVRLMPADGSPRMTIPLARIRGIDFSGKDAASGRSFETWMKKYVEKKLAGQRASIESEPIDDDNETSGSNNNR